MRKDFQEGRQRAGYRLADDLAFPEPSVAELSRQTLAAGHRAGIVALGLFDALFCGAKQEENAERGVGRRSGASVPASIFLLLLFEVVEAVVIPARLARVL